MADPADRHVRSVCPYCGVGCGIVLQVRQGAVVKVTGDRDHPANRGRLCSKGFTCAEPLTAPDRLVSAHLRSSRDGPLQPVPPEAAVNHAARRFMDIFNRHGPSSVALYVSGQLSSESQYLAVKLAKGCLRTNNIDSNSRLCMASAASGYRLSLGADGPPGSYEDIDRLNCALVIGANMAECHPILFLRLLDRQKQGARVIVVDPRRTPTAEKADLFLQIKPGTDLAFLNGCLHLIRQMGGLDHDFIRAHTEGWETLSELLQDYPPEKVSRLTGLKEEDLCKAAEWIVQGQEFTTFWTMGLNQSIHGTSHTNAICNLHLATGRICRPGSGPFSLTGQPNAMGGREVGYMSHSLPGQRAVTDPADRQFVEQLWNLPPGAISPEPGCDATTLFKNLESGRIKAVWIIGTNPVATMPDRDHVIAGLKRAELVIVQDAFHPTETSRFADVLLPGALWAEGQGTMVNSERNVTLMPQAVPPPGQARSDWQWIAAMGRAMGFDRFFPHADAAGVFDEIRQTWNPLTGYDLRGMDHAKLARQPWQWPASPGSAKGCSIRYRSEDGSVRFPTPSGRARFLARPHMPPSELPDSAFPYILLNGRLEHQWHTLTKTGKVKLLNKLNPGPFLQLNPVDAGFLGIHQGSMVRVSSTRGSAIYPAQVTTRVKPGECFAPIHWNDLYGDNLAVNAITSGSVDEISLQPGCKFSAVALAPVAPRVSDAFTPEQTHWLMQCLESMPRNGQSIPGNAPFSPAQRDFIHRLIFHHTNSPLGEAP